MAVFCSPIHGQGTLLPIKVPIKSTLLQTAREVFHHEGDQALAQVAQEGCWVSIPVSLEII